MKKALSLFLATALCLTLFGCSLTQKKKDSPEEKLYINEVVSSNKLSYLDAYYGVRDWIELYNGSDQDISLNGLYISDNLAGSGKLYALPNAVIPSGGYYILLCGGQGDNDLLPFNLSKSGEDISLVNRHREEIITVNIPALIRDVSYARRNDGTYGYCALPTPGQENTGDILDVLPESSALAIEEEKEEETVSVTYLPLKITAVQTNVEAYYCDACACWMDTVTLTNYNEEPVDIAGYCLNDKQNHVKKGLLPSYILQPQESVMILCCSENCALRDAHSCIDLGLSKNGDSLFLFDPNEVLIDTVEIPALSKGSTYKYNGSEWAIIEDEKKAQEEENPAPGQLPIDESVHINELLYKNKYSITDSYGDRSDFVELFNASNSPVSLNGWYLSDSEKRLDKWPLPDIVIQPGEYMLIFLSGRESTEYEWHASFSIKKGETIYLYDSVNNLLDSLYAYEVPDNVSLGRENGETVMYGAPTPGYANGHPWPIEKKE